MLVVAHGQGGAASLAMVVDHEERHGGEHRLRQTQLDGVGPGGIKPPLPQRGDPIGAQAESHVVPPAAAATVAAVLAVGSSC